MAGTQRIDVSSIRSFRIPVIPSSAPEVDTPDAFREGVSLMPHQRRALYRMKQVESDGELTEQNFGIHADVCARGGVLADAVCDKLLQNVYKRIMILTILLLPLEVTLILIFYECPHPTCLEHLHPLSSSRWVWERRQWSSH